MATYDNKHWLLSNIRNSFISTDDTGMCEIVMAGENFPKLFYNKAVEEKNKVTELTPTNSSKGGLDVVTEDATPKETVTEYDPYPELEESEDDYLMNGSYIRCEDFGPHRQRSNTALWLDKKEQALKKAAKIKIVKWENPQIDYTDEERSKIFPKKDLTKSKNNVQKRSLLADQLEKCPHLPHRQYLEYAKFDGTAQLGLPTKTFKIFMTMLPEDLQNYPINVCVIASAKIQDLVGFTCYKYSIEHPDISLLSAQEYGLCIAEDDGEVDWAFPCLDSNEPCSKFGFTCLGLVDLKTKLAAQQAGSMEDSNFSGAFQNMLFPRVSEATPTNPSRHNTGGSATSEAVLNAIQAVHDDRKGSNDRDPDLDRIHSHIMATEAPQYKMYRVQLLHKVRTNTAVHLGISLDRIEVEPVQAGTNKFWSRAKYFQHTIDTVAWCQVMESKSNRTTFRLVYTPGNSLYSTDSTSSPFFSPNQTPFKHHDFECEHDLAKEIVEKINRILDLRNSPCRREYKNAKEKKLQTRRSFHNHKLYT